MKISFVIAAYNAAEYLSKCLQSILSQGFADFEILVIDDGSTDETGAIARRHAAERPEIRVFRQENGGQGSARNRGVREASGDYIWFVDSDDWLVDNAGARIVAILEREAPDVLVVNFRSVLPDGRTAPSHLVPAKLAGRIFDPNESAQAFATVSCWQAPPWRLVAKRTLIVDNDIEFATGVFYEDHPFAIHLMMLATRVYLYAPVVYNYFQRPGSTTKNNDRKVFDFLQIRRECLSLFRRFDKLQAFQPIVLGYVLPRDFYFGHVGPEYQLEFLKRLRNDLTEDEAAYVRAAGIDAYNQFLKAVETVDPSLLAPAAVPGPRSWRERLTIGGARRFLARMKGAAAARVYGYLARIRQQVAERANPPQPSVDRTGRRYLQKGEGVRVEAINIDVRTAAENRPYVIVGDDSHIGGTFVFERGVGEIRIGSRSSIGGGCLLICSQPEGISIGDNVMLSWNCTLIDSNMHSLDPDIRATDAFDWKCGLDVGRIGEFKDWTDVAAGPIRIKDNAWLGFDVSVAKGVTIGKGAVIGSRSHVTRDVPDYCVFAGAPAKFVSLVPRKRWDWEELVCALNADPSKEALLKDAYLHRDLKSSVASFRTSGEFYETLQELKRLAPDAKKVVDVGGGNGVMSAAFALEGFDVTLVEPGEGELTGTAGARAIPRLMGDPMGQKIAENMKVKTSKVESFYGDGGFEIGYCRQMLHHLDDLDAGLASIRALLKDGALALFVREHVVFDEEDRDRFLKYHPFHKYVGNEFAYSAAQYEKAIEQAGFELLKTYKFADSSMNFHPHTAEIAHSLDEREIAGRPYSFIARKV